MDQYYEQGMELPDPESDFMQKLIEQEKEVANKKSYIKQGTGRQY